MHRVEDNLQDKRQPIIMAEQWGGPIKTQSKQVPDITRGKRCNCCQARENSVTGVKHAGKVRKRGVKGRKSGWKSYNQLPCL